MITIKKSKKELEDFIDSLIEIYPTSVCGIPFDKFKILFCNDFFDLSDDGSQLEIYKFIYNKIASNKTCKFFISIRQYIIDSFTKQFKFCPYCGKNPLIHFDEDNHKKRMFQFDHFLPKNYYHKGVINFYNLIPSCNACNHLKGEYNPYDKIVNGDKIYHPYFGLIFMKSGIIEYKETETLNTNTCFSKDVSREIIYNSDHGKFFKIPDKYFNDEETYNIFNFINDKRTKILAEKKNFKGCVKTDNQFKNYFFKNYSPEDEKDILKFSNGKLKKDLIDNLKI